MIIYFLDHTDRHKGIKIVNLNNAVGDELPYVASRAPRSLIICFHLRPPPVVLKLSVKPLCIAAAGLERLVGKGHLHRHTLTFRLSFAPGLGVCVRTYKGVYKNLGFRTPFL